MNPARANRRENRVLWVDDDIEDLVSYVNALRQHGFAVETAADARTAIELVSDDPLRYSAILVDIRMPQTDGIELIRQIRALQASAILIVLSSYLYLPFYREQLNALDFPVFIIDKDFPPIESPDFSERFLAPLAKAIKSKRGRLIRNDEEAIERAKHTDPFSIPLRDFMKLSIIEKDVLVQEAYARSEDVIRKEFEGGKVWVLLCGSSTQIRASAEDISEVLSDDEIMEFARIQKRAPFQFFRPVDLDDMWTESGDGKICRFGDYPTVSLDLNEADVAFHFDTGAPISFLSYEELLRTKAIKPVSTFGISERAGKPYYQTPVKIPAILVCQVKGRRREVEISGLAVREWHNSPFCRSCGVVCELRDSVAPNGYGICAHRRALIGRNLLTENRISLTLDGNRKKTILG